MYSWHGLKIFKNIDAGMTTLGGAGLIAASLILSYVIGHCIAILSTVSLERMAVLLFGYPSHFLMVRENKKEILCKICLNKSKFLFIFIFSPVQLFSYLLLIITTMHEHFVKDMSKTHISFLKKAINDQFNLDTSNIDGLSWFGLVERYVLIHNSTGASRMYNYLNLYGFCRNMSVCMICIFYFSVFSMAFSASKPSHVEILIYFSLAGSIILSFGFLKFFRRYSQEAIMNFIVIDKKTCNS